MEEQNLDIPNSSSNSKNPHFSLAKQKIIQSDVGLLGTVDTMDNHSPSVQEVIGVLSAECKLSPVQCPVSRPLFTSIGEKQ